VTESEFLERMDRRMAETNVQMSETRAHMARGNELMEQIREENRLNRLEHKRNQARFQGSQQVMREMLLELREGREVLKGIQAGMKDLRHGIQASTERLLRVLDELRRDGPSAAGA
jgi:hypothetical protein